MTRQMFSFLHLTSPLGFTSIITTILLHYCFISIFFNNRAYLILLIYDRSPISRVTIPEAVMIQFVLLMMSSVLLKTC